MSAHEIEEIDDIIVRVFEGDFGTRAQHREVLDRVLEEADAEHLTEYLRRQGLSKRVTSVMNRRIAATGLPWAPVANAEGQHVVLELMDFHELEYVIVGYLRKSSEHHAQALKVAEVAQEKFGKRPDLAALAKVTAA